MRYFTQWYTVCFIMLAVSNGYTSGNKPLSEMTIEDYRQKRGYTEGLDFAFVLMDSTQKDLINQQASKIHYSINHVSLVNDIAPIIADYKNVVVRIPHASIGQYGIKKSELDILTKIVDEKAALYKPIPQTMNSHYNIQGHNINLTATTLGNDTTLVIKRLYEELRNDYKTQVKDKFRIVHAQWLYDTSADKSKERQLIEEHYQSWNMPEDNRFNIHYTMIYNSMRNKGHVYTILNQTTVPDTLQNINFDTLGIAEIDFWGNPMNMIYKKKLGGK